ncbi:hypothetical protein M569_12067, partial [Genlisea aurea]
MASSGSESPPPPSLEELSTRGATSLLLPLILGMAATEESAPREVAVFVHQPTRSITLFEGSVGSESILGDLPEKEGPSPAAKTAIESLPLVIVSESDWECSICLSEDEGSEAKEMPCGHRFHSDCIDKWLGIHGSCPVCRFIMPAEEVGEGDDRAGNGGWMIHVFFARGRRR